jgi:hypothetical protein
MIVEFRRRTLLPLDEVFGCLKDGIPRLTRSRLHRCLVRHGILACPKARRKPPNAVCLQARQLATSTSISASCGSLKANSTCSWRSTGYRSSPMSNSMKTQARGRRRLPAKRRQSLPLQNPHDTHRQWHGFRRSTEEQERSHAEIFRRAHLRSSLHRERHRAQADKAVSPVDEWSAERMNRTIKEATIKVFHYPSLESLNAHVLAFVTAYNFAKHLNALRWKTPFEAICNEIP